MNLQAFRRKFVFIDQEESGFDFCLQILEVIGSFVFSVIGAFVVGIGSRDRCWKDGSEGYLMIVIISTCTHIQTDQIFA